MKKFLRAITFCLLLVSLAFSTIACSSNKDNDPPKKDPYASLGSNLGNVTETQWVSAFTLPAEVNNFSMKNITTLEDANNPTATSVNSQDILVSKDAIYVTGTDLSYDNETQITSSIVGAIVEVEEVYYMYQKMTTAGQEPQLMINGETGMTPENMYFSTLTGFATAYSSQYSMFTYNTEKKAFVYVQLGQSSDVDYEIHVSIYEKGFSVKRIQFMENSTYITEYAFYNINSTTVNVPQNIYTEINEYIANQQ